MTAYLFIRNSTPFLRSYISSFLHMLGKTTLETYLLQHHLWLASNAKQLLVILPDHPKINFFLCTLLFLFASQEIYRLTMSLRGMILPNDFGACVRNLGGMVAVLVVSGLVALFITPFFSFSSFVFSIFFLSATLIYFLDKKLNKFETFAKIHEEDDETKDDEMLEIELGEISSSSKNGQQEIEELSNQKESSAKKTNGDKLLKADPTTMKGYLIKNWKLCLSFLFFVIYLFHSSTPSTPDGNIQTPSTFSILPSSCLDKMSQGDWVRSTLSSSDYHCNPNSIVCTPPVEWIPTYASECKLSTFTKDSAISLLKNKNVTFVGDSTIRSMFHSLARTLELEDSGLSLKQQLDIFKKHGNIHLFNSDLDIGLSFYWTGYLKEMNKFVSSIKETKNDEREVIYVMGGGSWDILHNHDLPSYEVELSSLVGNIEKHFKKSELIWISLPSTVDERFPVDAKEKRKFLSSSEIIKYQAKEKDQLSTTANPITSFIKFNEITKGREDQCIDGIHYLEEVVDVVPQLILNSLSINSKLSSETNPKSSSASSTTTPQIGSLSHPFLGFCMVCLAFLTLFGFDSFFGLGQIGVKLSNGRLNWEEVYGPLHAKILPHIPFMQSNTPYSQVPTTTSTSSSSPPISTNEEDQELNNEEE